MAEHVAHRRERAADRWVNRLLLGAITLAGAALRISTMSTRSFWLDETTSIRQASWSIAEMLDLMSNNVHPPLFHTLLHYWIATMGRSELTVRMFAVAWGLLAIPLIYWLAATIYDRRVGLVTALLVALSPFFIWYSQEARMYTMMLVFAIVATGALWKGLEGGRFRWWAVYSLATAAGLMTQYFFGFLLAGHAIFVLTDRARRGAGALPRLMPAHSRRGTDAAGTPRPRVSPTISWMAAATFALIPLGWWLPKVIAHLSLLRGVSGAFNYGGPPPVVGFHFNELALVPVQWLFGFHSEIATRDLVAGWPLLITAVFLSASLARRISRRTAFLVISGVCGCALIAALGMWQPIVLEARYFTAAGVPLVVLAARTILDLRPSFRRTLAVLLLAVALVAWADQSFDPDSVVKWDNRAAMGIVADGFRPGDTILLIPNFVSSIPEYYLPPEAYASLRKVPLYDRLGQPRNNATQMAEDLERDVGPSRRVWVIATWQDTPRIELDRTMTGAWLAGQGFKVTGDHQLRRIRVTLFETGPRRGFFLDIGGGPRP